MATVTHGIATAATTNATSYASGSFTPATNDLLVAFVRAGATTAVGTMTSSTGITFTKVDHAVFAASAHRVYCFVANSLAANTSMTVTFDCAADAADGSVIFVARVAGMSRTGLGAVRRSAKTENGAAAGTPATTFSAAALTNNPTLGCVGNASSPAAVTPPTGWTENAAGDTGYSTPTSGAEYAYRDSGFTGTTITWASTSATTFGVLSIELDTTAVPQPNIIATPKWYYREFFNPPGSQIYFMPQGVEPVFDLPILLMPPRR